MEYLVISKNGRVQSICTEHLEGTIGINNIPEPVQREGFMPVMYYRNGKIEYEYEPMPAPPEPVEPEQPTIDYSHEVQSLIHERYSIDDEIALLRQKDTKPEEFKTYSDYCEECKTKVKSRML